MKDTVKEADLFLSGIMGYATPDYPKWTQGSMTFSETQKWNRERNQFKERNINPGQWGKIKREIEARSKANYDFLHPRRPPWWDAVVSAYLILPEEVRDTITKDEIEFLIEYTSPEAVQERKHQSRLAEQARKERTSRARKIRSDPVNKEADKNWVPKQMWSETDDIDELAWKQGGDGKLVPDGRSWKLNGTVTPMKIYKSKHDGGYWRWYYGRFERLINYLDWRKKHASNPPVPLQGIGTPDSSLDLSDPVFSAVEFDGNSTIGYLSPRGKKPSGRLREALGLRDAYRDRGEA